MNDFKASRLIYLWFGSLRGGPLSFLRVEEKGGGWQLLKMNLNALYSKVYSFSSILLTSSFQKGAFHPVSFVSGAISDHM